MRGAAKRRKNKAHGVSRGESTQNEKPLQGRKKMDQLPKIVQQSLRGTAKPAIHPDPDLLTAFAERSLNDRERSHVLQHLADCADCRDVRVARDARDRDRTIARDTKDHSG